MEIMRIRNGISEEAGNLKNFLKDPRNRVWIYFWGVIFLIICSGAISIVAESTKTAPEGQLLPVLQVTETAKEKGGGITCWTIPSVISVFTIDQMVRTVLTVKDSFDDPYYEETGSLILGEVFQLYLEELLDRDPLSPEAWGLLEETFPFGVKYEDPEWKDVVLTWVVCGGKLLPIDNVEFFKKINERWGGGQRLIFEEEKGRLCRYRSCAYQ